MTSTPAPGAGPVLVALHGRDGAPLDLAGTLYLVVALLALAGVAWVIWRGRR